MAARFETSTIKENTWPFVKKITRKAFYSLRPPLFLRITPPPLLDASRNHLHPPPGPHRDLSLLITKPPLPTEGCPYDHSVKYKTCPAKIDFQAISDTILVTLLADIRLPGTFVVHRDENLEYGVPQCGFNTKHQSTSTKAWQPTPHHETTFYLNLGPLGFNSPNIAQRHALPWKGLQRKHFCFPRTHHQPSGLDQFAILAKS